MKLGSVIFSLLHAFVKKADGSKLFHLMKSPKASVTATRTKIATKIPRGSIVLKCCNLPINYGLCE